MATLKPKEILPVKDNAFENCKLGREEYAKILTDIISSYADGFVMSIDSEWGGGKTTFIKMWQQQLEDTKFKTIYFNAWESDFEKDALIALLAEIKIFIGEEDNKILTKSIQYITKFSKAVMPALIKAFLEKHIKTEVFTDAIRDATKTSYEIIDSELEAYTKKKDGLKEFRTKLSDFVAKKSDNPLVFFVDELDRCRPSYAVEVLETIKHFFSVPGIVFVLAINKRELANAVRGYYGSENIDGELYLKRFIDLEYSLPKPELNNFIEMLYDHFQLNQFFETEIRKSNSSVNQDDASFKNFLVGLSISQNLNLRSIEKLIARTSIVLKSHNEIETVFPRVLCLIMYLNEIKNDIYQEIQSKKITLADLAIELEKLVSKDLENEQVKVLIRTIAATLIFYSRDVGLSVDDVYHKNAENKYVTTFKSPLSDSYVSDLELFADNRSYRGWKLSTFVNRIQLLNNLVVKQ